MPTLQSPLISGKLAAPQKAPVHALYQAKLAPKLSKPVEQCGGQIAFGEGRYNEDDVFAFKFGAQAYFDRAGDGRTRRYSHWDALQACDEPRRVERGLIADGQDFVD